MTSSIWQDFADVYKSERGFIYRSIGSESVKAIVGKNKDYCKFRYDGKTFYSEIILRQV